jgi:hypothetical protein
VIWSYELSSLKNSPRRLKMNNSTLLKDEKDQKFRLLQDFGHITLQEYDHGYFLGKIKNKYEKKFINFSNNITDRNFRGVTEEIRPFTRYNVKAYTSNEPFEDIIAFMGSENASFLGVQGLFLLWMKKKDEFERGYTFVSLDEKEGLWSYLEDKYATAVIRHKREGYLFYAEIKKIEEIISQSYFSFLVFKKI